METNTKKYRPTLAQINDSISNGQRLQTVDQIKEYGVADFFLAFDTWLYENGGTQQSYIRAVKWYHGQKKRTRHD